MDNWDIVILAVAGYAAVMSLVRLMARQRDQLLGEFRQQMKAERQNRPADEPDGQWSGESKAA